MAKFRFRFESLLRHRRMVEDEKQRDLAQSMRTRHILHGELGRMQQTIRDSKQQLGDGLVGTVDLDRISGFARYSGQVTERGRQIVVRLSQVEKQIEQARLALIEAMRQRKALERLRERQHRNWITQQERRERTELDELATQRYARALAMGAVK